MTEYRLDRLSMRLAAHLTRRSVLAGLLGVSAVVAVGDDALAAPRRTCRSMSASCTRSAQCCSGFCTTSGPRRLRNRCTCPGESDTVCPTGCVDLEQDANNCGACGYACRAGQTCSWSTCVTECELATNATICITRPDNTTDDACATDLWLDSSDYLPENCGTDSDCQPIQTLPTGYEAYCTVGLRFSDAVPYGVSGEPFGFTGVPGPDSVLGRCLLLAPFNGTCD